MKRDFGIYVPGTCPMGHKFPSVQLLLEKKVFVCTRCFLQWKAMTRTEYRAMRREIHKTGQMPANAKTAEQINQELVTETRGAR